MILRVTNAVKNGEIVLPTIGYAVKAGIQLTISDEDVYRNDIQIAIRKGFLEIADEQGHGKSPFAKRIAVTNLSGRPLALDAISLLVGETSYISERELNSTNVQTAINAGLIDYAVPEEAEQPESEDVEEQYVEEKPQVKPRRSSQARKPAKDTKFIQTEATATKKTGKRKVEKLMTRPTVKQNAPKSATKISSQPVGKKGTRPFPVADKKQEDRLSRLQQIAAKTRTGNKSKPSSLSANEDSNPVNRLARLARQIETEQEGEEQYDEENINFIDQTDEDVEAELEDEGEMRERIEQARQQASGTRMSAWNPHTKMMMGREESSRKVAKLVVNRAPAKRSVNQDGIMTGDIDFSDDGVRTAKKVTTSPMKKGASKRPGLQPVGRRRAEPNTFDEESTLDDYVDDGDDISFVDREQETARLMSRPDLLRRNRSNNIEIE